MPLLLLLVLALTVGFVVGLVAWRYPQIARPPAAPTLDAARKVGETVGKHSSLRAVLAARLDPAVATGLALTLALFFAIGAGVLLGVLAYLVRTNSQLIGIDNSVAKWGNRHASAMSMHVLNDVTQLGGIYTVIVLCVVLAVAATIRERSIWVAPFIVAVDRRGAPRYWRGVDQRRAGLLRTRGSGQGKDWVARPTRSVCSTSGHRDFGFPAGTSMMRCRST